MAPIYFPAISFTTSQYLTYTDDILIGGVNRPRSPRFFNSNETSYFDHPYILISAALHYKKHPDVKKKIRISDKTKVFIDSGGYQLAVGAVTHKEYNCKISLEFSEKNGNIYPILDHPITTGCDKEERLKSSCESAKYYIDHRSVEGHEILNVVSGNTLEGTSIWYDKIKQFKLDGWCHGGHAGVFNVILQTFMHLGTMGEFNKGYTVPYHVFGVSSQLAFVYLAVMQQEAIKLGWDVRVMSDSSSFQKTLGHGNLYVMPTWTGMGVMQFSNKFDLSVINKDSRMPCDCPVCDGITDLKEFINDPKQFYLLGALHNLAIVLRYRKIVDAIVDYDSDEIIKSALPAKISANIFAIKDAMKDPTTGKHKIYYTFTHNEPADECVSLSGFLV